MKKKHLKLTSLLLCIFILLSATSCTGLLQNDKPNETTARAESTVSSPTESTPSLPESTVAPSIDATTSAPESTPVPSVEETSSELQAPPQASVTEDSTPDISVTDGSSTGEIVPTATVPVDAPDLPESVPSDVEGESSPEDAPVPEIGTTPIIDAPAESPDIMPPVESTPDEVVVPEAPMSDVSFAAAQGLRSAVSVICSFNGGSSGSAGSGVIYKLEAESGSAFIITNYHVVYNSASKTANRISDDINVLLFGLEYEEYAIPATYVGGSANYDIAILRVDNSELLKASAENGSAKEITISNSDFVAAGQTAIAIGNPEADGISVTTGIVSVDSEHITMNAINGLGSVEMRVIRIDTAVNSGNSGGGLFNARGELIGIVNAKIKSEDVENIGYAIPSNVARAIADNIIDYCYEKECETVMRGMLGVTISMDSITTDYDEELGMIVITQKIKVVSVNQGGLAEEILMPDDIISAISINGDLTTITRQHHVIDAMLDVREGDKVEMTILRAGEEMTVETIITEDCLVAY